VAKRLTNEEKKKLVEGFCKGASPVELAEEFSCSSNTINRVVKLSIGNEEYKRIRAERSKEKNLNLSLENEKSLDISNEVVVNENINILEKEEKLESINVFKEIEPLIDDFGFEENKQKVSLKKLTLDIFPEVVYLLVSQKIEIELKPIREYPEWSFLPEDEQDRYAINLFDNQRSAKRSCARNQRVIKIPDCNLFIISAPYLISKGITRILFDDLLISVD